MTWRALLACAAALAAGCRGRQREDVGPVEITPARPAPAEPPADAGPPSEARCRAAAERIFQLVPLVSPSAAELVPVFTEACQSAAWSDATLGCVQGARDAQAVEPCKLTAEQVDYLRRHLIFAANETQADGELLMDALRPGALPGLLSPSPLELRLRGYAKLLALDVSLFQAMAAYPGAPPGTTFETREYEWNHHQWISLPDLQKELEGSFAAAAAATPRTPADAAVQEYGRRVAEWVPQLIALVQYYDAQRFVDDEFDRGRREAASVQRAAAELGKLRRPMRAAVFGAWREHIAAYRDTPRGAAATAWMACMAIADRVMEQAAPAAVTSAVSECRRAIGGVTEMAPASGFDREVRTAAVELGDWVAQGHPSWRTMVGDTLGKFTLRYLQLWPRLAGTPAERRAP